MQWEKFECTCAKLLEGDFSNSNNNEIAKLLVLLLLGFLKLIYVLYCLINVKYLK